MRQKADETIHGKIDMVDRFARVEQAGGTTQWKFFAEMEEVSAIRAVEARNQGVIGRVQKIAPKDFRSSTQERDEQAHRRFESQTPDFPVACGAHAGCRKPDRAVRHGNLNRHCTRRRLHVKPTRQGRSRQDSIFVARSRVMNKSLDNVFCVRRPDTRMDRGALNCFCRSDDVGPASRFSDHRHGGRRRGTRHGRPADRLCH